MEKLGWLFIVFGALLLIMASFPQNALSLSPQITNPSDFQLIIAICGLVAIVVGIIKQ